MVAKQDPTLPTIEKFLDADAYFQDLLAFWWRSDKSGRFCGLGTMARNATDHFNKKGIYRVREGKILPSRIEAYLRLFLARKLMEGTSGRMDIWISGAWHVWTRPLFEGLELTCKSVQDRVKSSILRNNHHKREAHYLQALTWMRRHPGEVPKVLALIASLWRRTETEILNDLEELASSVTVL